MAEQVLKKRYEDKVAPLLAKEFDIPNKMAVPKIEKVVVNSGIGHLSSDKGDMKKFKEELATITGQMPAERAAKVSVAGFSIRKGMPVGLKVTLRGKKMYDFLQRLFSIVLPRLRDFRGVSLESFDNSGNYTLGISEHTVFPEIDVGKTTARGLEITIVTNTKEVEQSKRLLAEMGMPFEKEE